MTSPLVTIVSPIYNGEKFVRQCMQSVLSQTYQNWRYFFLDNASTDRTGEIAREIAATDPRIRVVRNESTVPVMQNHNLAVALTPPDSVYMRILQGDDVLAPECIERSVAVGEEHPSVGMIGSYLQWGAKRTSTEFDPRYTCFDGREVARRTLRGETYPFLSPSAILFRWAAVCDRERFYDEERLYGDVMASYETLRQWDFGLVHEVLTEVGSDEGSVTNTAAAAFNKMLGSNLDLLARYGPEFLGADEYADRVEEHLARYYEFLAYAYLDGRGDDFWAYHGAMLSGAKVPLSKGRLLKQVVVNMAHNPRGCAWRVYRRAWPKR